MLGNQRLKGIINAVQRAIGTTTGHTTSTAIPTSSNAVELWKGKLGNTLASRILGFFAENPSRDFTREQVALALGIAAKAGHTANEWGKLMRTATVVKNGGMYRLNPNL